MSTAQGLGAGYTQMGQRHDDAGDKTSADAETVPMVPKVEERISETGAEHRR